jgi:hypothetical protein
MNKTLTVPDSRLSEIFKIDSIIFNGSYTDIISGDQSKTTVYRNLKVFIFDNPDFMVVLIIGILS